MEIKITERGWAGHYICSNKCGFRRNTLVEYKNKKIIVSTVGNYSPHLIDTYTEKEKEIAKQIGYNRYYETMCFKAKKDGIYWDIDVSKPVEFKSKWSIDKLEFETDLEANDMHEQVVEEIKNLITN